MRVLLFICIISIMKQQFEVTYTVLQIPELLDSWVTNAPYVKMSCPYIFLKT